MFSAEASLPGSPWAGSSSEGHSTCLQVGEVGPQAILCEDIYMPNTCRVQRRSSTHVNKNLPLQVHKPGSSQATEGLALFQQCSILNT